MQSLNEKIILKYCKKFASEFKHLKYRYFYLTFIKAFVFLIENIENQKLIHTIKLLLT